MPTGTRCHHGIGSSTLIEGWTMTTPARRAFTKTQIVEHDIEFADLFSRATYFRRERARMLRQGRLDELPSLYQSVGDGIADMLAYSLKVWRERGQWLRFFWVPSGAVHTTTGCKTVSLQTQVTFLPSLSGDSMETVEGRGYKLCGHCRARTPETYAHTLDHVYAVVISELPGRR